MRLLAKETIKDFNLNLEYNNVKKPPYVWQYLARGFDALDNNYKGSQNSLPAVKDFCPAYLILGAPLVPLN